MKNLKIDINNHQAILSFKKITNTRFETLKWKLIEQNLDEILESLSIDINEVESSTLTKKGD